MRTFVSATSVVLCGSLALGCEARSDAPADKDDTKSFQEIASEQERLLEEARRAAGEEAREQLRAGKEAWNDAFRDEWQQTTVFARKVDRRLSGIKQQLDEKESALTKEARKDYESSIADVHMEIDKVEGDVDRLFEVTAEEREQLGRSIEDRLDRLDVQIHGLGKEEAPAPGT